MIDNLIHPTSNATNSNTTCNRTHKVLNPALTPELARKLCPLPSPPPPSQQLIQEMWEQDIGDKAEALYLYLLSDAWNCYRNPELYPDRLQSPVQRGFWFDVVEMVQVISPEMLQQAREL